MNKSKSYKISSHYKESYWKLQFEAYKNSDLTIVQFCKSRNISRSTFHNWKQRFDQQSKQNFLIPVSVSPSLKSLESSSSSGISLIINDKYEIQLEKQFHTETLTRLIKELEER